jgi:hypothetical protein
MDLAIPFLLDIVAIAVMTFGLYFPRHRRRDMVVAFIGVNLGLLAVTVALGTSGMSLGLGFGLFAVLSIIRLRSAELDQQEVAYYFAAMALGLLGGIQLDPAWLTPALMGLLLLGLWLGDHPRLFGRYRVQAMTLDGTWQDEAALVARLEEMLGGRIHRLKVRRIDLVEATTSVEVRYELPAAQERRARVVPGAVDGVAS